MRVTETELARIMQRQGKPERTATALPCPTEAEEQAAVIEWATAHAARLPGVDAIFHVPNGEERSKAAGARLKAQGVRPGIPDLCIPVARGGYHGLWIELKRADRSNGPTQAQRAWMERLQHEGYYCVLAYGAGEAIDAIRGYLEMV